MLEYPRVRQLISLFDEQIQMFLEEFRKETILIEVENEVDAVANDPTDNMFLALAVAGQVQYLVTGDKKHLLPLQSYQGIQIISPAIFLTLYHQTS